MSCARSRYPAGLELVKWAAFAAMLVDHVDLVLFERSIPWAYQVGRFALPAFALAFGVGLAHSSNPLRIALRLVAPGAVAQLAWLLVDPSHPGNVLLTFAAFAVVAAAWRMRAWPLLLGLAGLVVVGSGVYEGGRGALLLTLAGFVGASLPAAHRLGAWPAISLHVAAAAPWLLLFPSPGLLAGLAAPHAARWLPTLPRWSRVLPWAYAGHLWALVALRELLTLV